jgi:hypothetical protein
MDVDQVSPRIAYTTKESLAMPLTAMRSTGTDDSPAAFAMCITLIANGTASGMDADLSPLALTGKILAALIFLARLTPS